MSELVTPLRVLWSRERVREALVLLFLLALALLPRLYRLSAAPPGLSGDELFNAIDAAKLGRGGWPLFFEGNNGREALFLYLMSASLNLFGKSVWAVRLPAVLLGAGGVLLAYGIGRNEFNRRVGIIGAALMAVSLWPVMQSRWGLRAVSLTFFSALTIYLYGRALRREDRALLAWAVAGLSLGLTMYTYIPSRLFPFVILGWLGWIAVLRRDLIGRCWRGALLSLLVAAAVFAPFAVYMLQFPDKVNQRLGAFNTSIDKALAGEPFAIIERLWRLFLTFIASGDPAGRYNIDERPIFDPLTALFFFLGLAACLWLAFRRQGGRRKRSSYGMLLLWIGAMLAPSAILSPDTSSLRIAGAMAPIYLTTAIGIELAFVWIGRKWPQRKRFWSWALPGALALGLLFTLLGAWQAYFVDWTNDGLVRAVYRAELARIGEYLEDNPPPAGTRLYAGYNYVADMTPQGFPYHNDQAVSWFTYANSFSWPASGESVSVQSAWYFVAATKPLVEEAMAKLNEIADLVPVAYENGDLAFTLYKIKPEELAWSPQERTDLHFVDGPRLVGFDSAEEFFRGDTLPITLHWQVPEDQTPLPNRLTYAQLWIEDESGNAWGKVEKLMGYPEAGWQPGDRFTRFLEMEVPEGMPPGPAYFRFGLRDWSGPAYGVIANSPERIGPFLVRGRPVADLRLEPGTPVFDDTLALQGHTFSSLVAPGLPMNISLDWLALKEPQVDYAVRLHLSEPGSDRPCLYQTFAQWPDTYPPTQWQQGEQISTFHKFDIPLDLATTVDPLLKIELVSPEGSESLPLSQGSDVLASLKLSRREHIFEPPDIGRPMEAQFGESIRLLGYDLDEEEIRPGGEVALTLYWQAIDTPDEGYTVFNHLVGRDGQIQGQFDSPPVGDAWLTSTWLPGEIIVDRRTVPLRPGTPGGSYSLMIGLYNASDGLRLPVFVDGEAQPNDQLLLTEVMIGS
jgi:4-amino-4-deoxy-L-arabinose transferase-like glycosyltransferase